MDITKYLNLTDVKVGILDKEYTINKSFRATLSLIELERNFKQLDGEDKETAIMRRLVSSLEIIFVKEINEVLDKLTVENILKIYEITIQLRNNVPIELIENRLNGLEEFNDKKDNKEKKKKK